MLEERVRQLLVGKSPRDRAVILLRMEFYSYSEIAERLGISENSARVIEFRVRRWLRSVLEEEGMIEHETR